jgi:uncharacterized protein (TIGR02147 family)
MASVYDSNDYKLFLRDWLHDRPKNGRGEARQIAQRLNISTTLVSQVLNGDKHFTMESASDLVDYLALTDREGDHFLLLVDFARAGSHRLKARLKRRIEQSRESARELANRMKSDRNLTDAQSAVYYSHWVYTGITNFVATEPRATAEGLAERLQIPAEIARKVLAFLLESGILVNQSGRLEMGVKNFHIGADSPLVIKHHQNWRIKGFQHMPYTNSRNLFFTAPMSLSQEVADRVRDELPNFIEKIVSWVGPSPSETVRCLNLDWFEY